MKNIKKVVLYSEGYKPKEEILSFAKSLGYDNIKDPKCRMDKKFINFIKNHLDLNNNNSNELIHINSVDTSKKWCIMHNARKDSLSNKRFEEIVYVNIYQQEQNFVKISLV